MRLSPGLPIPLGAPAALLLTLLFALCAQAGPQDDAIASPLALDDVDVDALLAAVEPDALMPRTDSEPATETDSGAIPASPLPFPIHAARRDDWRSAWTTLRNRTAESGARLLQAARIEGRKPPEEIARDVASFLREIPRHPVERAIILTLAAVLLLPFSVRKLRGVGDLAVCIDYPTELRGTFDVRLARRSIRVAKRRGKASTPANPVDARRDAGGQTRRSRTEHSMVSRETTFQNVAVGRYYVTVEGFLQGVESDELLKSHCEEREVRLRRSATVREVFDFLPSECPVDVKVVWDKRPVTDARVALRGEPGSLRSSRGRSVRLDLRPGPHTLVVGSGDRVAEHRIDASSFQPVTVEIDLGGRENVLFSGCPPAVEPYLLGDVPTAARALEREGQREVSHLLFARFHHERDQYDTAARHFESAGLPLDAAQLRQSLGQYEASATLYELAGEIESAAAMYRSAGKLVEAGEAFERVHDYDSAVECFRTADDLGRWVRALEKLGASYEAARIALERGDNGRAIHSLQQMSFDDIDYLEGSELLVELYEKEGHFDLAAGKIEEMIRNRGAQSVSLDCVDRVAGRLEATEDYVRALEMLEIMRRVDPAREGVAGRIESARKRRSQIRAGSSLGMTNASSVHAFTNESRYEIIEEIGRGGMGVVFKARDRRLERVVAIKRLSDNLRNHPNAVKLFLREARSSAALNHPNIVTVYDAGQEGDAYYISMELLQGSPLNDILRHHKKLSALQVAQLGIQITNGLYYAHEQRIIHRDIKTANLFYTTAKTLKIMDFGLAKMQEEVRRASTMIGGTPYYMAPEQSLGEGVDHRADLYALGVTFFELLTGKVPFPEGDVAMHHRHSPPPDPRERSEEVPDSLAELVLQMLEKSPDDRPATAGEIGQRLHEIARALS